MFPAEVLKSSRLRRFVLSEIGGWWLVVWWWLVFEMAQFPSEPVFCCFNPCRATLSDSERLYYPCRHIILARRDYFQHSSTHSSHRCHHACQQRHDNFKHITSAVKKQDSSAFLFTKISHAETKIGSNQDHKILDFTSKL